MSTPTDAAPPEPFYVETTLPSGSKAYIWVTENCAVIKVNGLVTHAARSFRYQTDSPDRLAELIPLLMAAAEPSKPRWIPAP